MSRSRLILLTILASLLLAPAFILIPSAAPDADATTGEITVPDVQVDEVPVDEVPADGPTVDPSPPVEDSPVADPTPEPSPTAEISSAPTSVVEPSVVEPPIVQSPTGEASAEAPSGPSGGPTVVAPVQGEVAQDQQVEEEPDAPTEQRPGTEAAVSGLIAIAPMALVTPVGNTGGFEIDGDLPINNAGDDWANHPGVANSDGTGDVTQFSNGSKEMDHPDTWSNGTGTAPPKDDIVTSYSYTHTSGGNVWTYFGFVRNATGGTTAYDIEFNQLANTTASPPRPNRTAGDLMIQVAQHGSSDFTINDVFIWRTAGSMANCETVPGYPTTSGWCPLVVPGGAFYGETSADGTFAEGALNLSAIFGNGTCVGDFGTVNMRSRSSDVTTAALKDWVAPTPVSVQGNCGGMVISKRDQYGNLVGGATYRIVEDPGPARAEWGRPSPSRTTTPTMPTPSRA